LSRNLQMGFLEHTQEFILLKILGVRELFIILYN